MTAAVRPGQLLAGLVVGVLSLAVFFSYLWPLAWLAPALLAVVLLPLRQARSFALGVLAAACGALAFVLTMVVLLGMAPTQQTLPPPPAPSTSNVL